MCGSEFGPGGAALRRVGAGLAMLLLAGSVLAQQAPSREQEQIRRLRLQVQQLQQAQQARQQADAQALDQARAEAAALQQQLAAAQAALRGVRGNLDSQTRSAAEAQRLLDAQRQEREALDARLAAQAQTLQTTQQALDQQRQALADHQRRLAQRESALADLQARHASQARGLQTCATNNAALHALGHELLQRWVDKTVAEVLAQSEPFVQTRRVALENLVDGYRDKLDAQALRAGTPEAGRAP
jgi:chromosome segregation ATPase